MILLIVLGVITVCLGGSYILFNLNDRNSNPLKRKGFWILAGASSVVLSIASPYILVFILLWQSGVTPRPFDPERWKNEPRKWTELVDDLINKKLLDGLAREDVVELLGDPIKDSPYFVSTGREMIYHLGNERHPFGVDSEWLLIWLEGDKVTQYEVRTD